MALCGKLPVDGRPVAVQRKGSRRPVGDRLHAACRWSTPSRWSRFPTQHPMSALVSLAPRKSSAPHPTGHAPHPHKCALPSRRSKPPSPSAYLGRAAWLLDENCCNLCIILLGGDHLDHSLCIAHLCSSQLSWLVGTARSQDLGE